MVDEDLFPYFPYATGFIILFYTCLLVGYAFCGIGSLIFSPFSAKNFILAGFIVLLCLIIFGVVALLKYLVVFLHKKCKAKKSTLLRNQIVIGLSGIALFVILPRVLVFFVGPVNFNNPTASEFTFFIFFILSGPLCCIISVSLYFLFVVKCDKRYELDSKKLEKPNFIIGVLHLVVLIVTIKMALIFNSDKDTSGDIIIYQVLSTLIGFPTIIDLYGILSGGTIKLEGAEEEEAATRNAENVRLESVKVVPKTEEVSRLERRETCKNQEPLPARINPKIDCKICLLEYSDILIPRILNGCGHTICEECTESMLKKNEGKFLLCPFCQKGTVVNGPASLLQKNYGILEIIND